MIITESGPQTTVKLIKAEVQSYPMFVLILYVTEYDPFIELLTKIFLQSAVVSPFVSGSPAQPGYEIPVGKRPVAKRLTL